MPVNSGISIQFFFRVLIYLLRLFIHLFIRAIISFKSLNIFIIIALLYLLSPTSGPSSGSVPIDCYFMAYELYFPGALHI